MPEVREKAVGPVEITVVIPCLDEERAIGAVIDQAWEGIERSGRSGEVLVVDNGSTDRSAEIAAAHGARVVTELRRGYGSAYLAGLARARGTYIVMTDADGTYPVRDLAPFVEMLEDGADMVIGSRFKGRIHDGAMPTLNRRVGNPILTGMLNLLFGIKVSDAHCGLRAIRSDVVPALDLNSLGMEFASEMVFKAFRRGLHVGEIPIDYYPRTGESKLNPFGDGWRHVALMLLYSPNWLYLLPAGVLFGLGLVGTLFLAGGPVTFLGRTWNIHTELVLVGCALVGAQLLQLWVFSRVYRTTHLAEPDPHWQLLRGTFTLGRGVLLGSMLFLAGCLVMAWVAIPWIVRGLGELQEAHAVGLAVLLLGLGVQVVFGSFFIALMTLQTLRDVPLAASESVPIVAVGDRDPLTRELR